MRNILFLMQNIFNILRDFDMLFVAFTNILLSCLLKKKFLSQAVFAIFCQLYSLYLNCGPLILTLVSIVSKLL